MSKKVGRDPRKMRKHYEAVFREVISGIVGDQNQPGIQTGRHIDWEKMDGDRAKPRLLLIRLKKDNVDLIMMYRKLLQ